ncbi:hypothetical protein AM1_5492 [Acaryochloris marina MBIC11017]|uniref:Uncharacterized protein n=1 Tax=Acaryochloris marina (strain MBIC 11017) TaxID=329726 RepID=B0CD06_ACAM1|nr:hypothetical protein AM1_5492 [Acaryochloris marina MBIC11017]
MSKVWAGQSCFSVQETKSAPIECFSVMMPCPKTPGQRV